ncbi:MAG TPA: hypothetical protein VFT19_03150 [Solirubrobacterales bacterium]|nr:hypothetical protein [Solirubrobacterales bacterium]
MGSSARKTPLPAIGVALLVALLVAVPALAAEGEAELTRDQYVAKLEPICKANTRANSRILKGVKGQVQRGKLGPAGKRFIRASGALGRSVRTMARVPRPAADTTKLSKWFGYLMREKRFLQLIGKSLKSGNKFKAQKLAVKLNRNNNQANNTVISFGFRECRIDSSRFI